MDRFQKLKPLWDPFVEPIIHTYASAASFHLLLSVMPASVLLLSVLPYLSSLFLTLFSIVTAPAPMLSLFRYLTEKASMTSPSITISVSALFIVRSASKGILMLLDGINASMHAHRLTGIFRRHLTAMIYFFFFTAALLLSLFVLVLGNTLLDLLQRYDPPFLKIITAISRYRSVMTILLLGPSFSLMYRLLPSERKPFRLCLQSGYLAASAWVISSVAFSFYVNNFSALPRLYGSIGGIALGILWLRICITVLLEGAVLIRIRHEDRYAPLQILRSAFI